MTGLEGQIIAATQNADSAALRRQLAAAQAILHLRHCELLREAIAPADCPKCADMRAALSGEAGVALLGEVEQLRQVAHHARSVRDSASTGEYREAMRRLFQELDAMEAGGNR